MNTDLMFSSKDQTWETPIDFFNLINEEFNFNLDVCASEFNCKCDNYFDETIDGLKQEWNGVCWCNPPYGREISKWVEKAYKESLKGNVIVMLIPSRTDTTYWHKFIFPYASEVRFIKGRLKFGNSKNSAPFPSALIVFGGEFKGCSTMDSI
jgi:site-specific DNA-methyltransferase (adenine-specific)